MKARRLAGRRLHLSGTKKATADRIFDIRSSISPSLRHSTSSATPQTENDETARQSAPQTDSTRQKLAEREFFLSVLSTTATKRDAKSYLSRFKPQQPKPHTSAPSKVQQPVSDIAGSENHNKWRLHRSGVNLGSLYGQPRAIEESPVFTQQPLPDTFKPETADPLHVAVVKIRGVRELDEKTLNGVGLTLAQLAKLDLLSAVVVDCDESSIPEQPGKINPKWKEEVMEQCARVVNAIRRHSRVGARIVDHALTVKPVDQEIPRVVHVRGGVEVGMEELFQMPMRNGIIPVIPPIALNSSLAMQQIHPDDAMLALTREFAGLTSTMHEKEPKEMIERLHSTSRSLQPVSLDRVIVLDPLGGLPANNRADKSHVFVNLEQEYRDVRLELASMESSSYEMGTSTEKTHQSVLGDSNPFTKFLESEMSPPPGQRMAKNSQTPQSEQAVLLNRHIKNLDLIHRCLTLLPPSSSALLTTPAEAASSALTAQEQVATGVGTRPKRNPLIHNLLTDKPVVSSSLPAARLTSPTPRSAISPLTPATFFKSGMPLTIIPDSRNGPWKPPGPEGTSLRLESDPRIDFPRLLYLIEDSFGRPLDVQHYLSRIQNRLAGAIIAGEYEGGAILTWEQNPKDPSRPPVPYLDKFAVLRKSQGSGGVADIVFNAMVRACLPDGVVWRSRQNNPVNKWYFERSVGTWKLPGSQWCMFWTGNDVDWGDQDVGEGEERESKILEDVEKRTEKERRWHDYVNVCSSIEASWADRDTKPPD